MACDMCGKKGVDLATLSERYKTKDVQSICSSCDRILNSHLHKMRAVTDGLLKTMMKRFICNYIK
jgi:hypothetical protein